MQPAVFLDRDNTLIANDGDLGDPRKVVLLDGVAEGLLRLKRAGWKLLVVSNQGGVARGRYGEDDVHAVHEEISRQLKAATSDELDIDGYYFCPFHPEGTVAKYQREHPWRKPQPGMLLEAARAENLDLAGSWMIGDQERDIDAGKAAGCRTILIAEAPSTDQGVSADGIAADLIQAATIILETQAP